MISVSRSLPRAFETAEGLEILTGLQCDIGQGFYFGKPMALPDFEDWLNHSEWRRRTNARSSREAPSRQHVEEDVVRLRNTAY